MTPPVVTGSTQDTVAERAGIRGLSDGQKVSFDTAEDQRSGKIAVDNISAA